MQHFEDAEKECASLLDGMPPLPLPAYDQCMKASHLFNLLDARGVISVAERQGYIGRVRRWRKPVAKHGSLLAALMTGGCQWLNFIELFGEEIPARMQKAAEHVFWTR